MPKKLKSDQTDEDFSRRELARKGAKAAYVAPLVLSAVKASERPAFGQASNARDKAKGPKEKKEKVGKGTGPKAKK